jgi:hypothetical protein
MSLFDEIIAIYPELLESMELFKTEIVLIDEPNNGGEKIVLWNYEKPLDKSLESYLA